MKQVVASAMLLDTFSLRSLLDQYALYSQLCSIPNQYIQIWSTDQRVERTSYHDRSSITWQHTTVSFPCLISVRISINAEETAYHRVCFSADSVAATQLTFPIYNYTCCIIFQPTFIPDQKTCRYWKQGVQNKTVSHILFCRDIYHGTEYIHLLMLRLNSVFIFLIFLRPRNSYYIFKLDDNQIVSNAYLRGRNMGICREFRVDTCVKFALYSIVISGCLTNHFHFALSTLNIAEATFITCERRYNLFNWGAGWFEVYYCTFQESFIFNYILNIIHKSREISIFFSFIGNEIINRMLAIKRRLMQQRIIKFVKEFFKQKQHRNLCNFCVFRLWFKQICTFYKHYNQLLFEQPTFVPLFFSKNHSYIALRGCESQQSAVSQFPLDSIWKNINTKRRCCYEKKLLKLFLVVWLKLHYDVKSTQNGFILVSNVGHFTLMLHYVKTVKRSRTSFNDYGYVILDAINVDFNSNMCALINELVNTLYFTSNKFLNDSLILKDRFFQFIQRLSVISVQFILCLRHQLIGYNRLCLIRIPENQNVFASECFKIFLTIIPRSGFTYDYLKRCFHLFGSKRYDYVNVIICVKYTMAFPIHQTIIWVVFFYLKINQKSIKFHTSIEKCHTCLNIYTRLNHCIINIFLCCNFSCDLILNYRLYIILFVYNHDMKQINIDSSYRRIYQLKKIYMTIYFLLQHLYQFNSSTYNTHVVLISWNTKEDPTFFYTMTHYNFVLVLEYIKEPMLFLFDVKRQLIMYRFITEFNELWPCLLEFFPLCLLTVLQFYRSCLEFLFITQCVSEQNNVLLNVPIQNLFILFTNTLNCSYRVRNNLVIKQQLIMVDTKQSLYYIIKHLIQTIIYSVLQIYDLYHVDKREQILLINLSCCIVFNYLMRYQHQSFFFDRISLVCNRIQLPQIHQHTIPKDNYVHTSCYPKTLNIPHLFNRYDYKCFKYVLMPFVLRTCLVRNLFNELQPTFYSWTTRSQSMSRSFINNEQLNHVDHVYFRRLQKLIRPNQICYLARHYPLNGTHCLLLYQRVKRLVKRCCYKHTVWVFFHKQFETIYSSRRPNSNHLRIKTCYKYVITLNYKLRSFLENRYKKYIIFILTFILFGSDSNQFNVRHLYKKLHCWEGIISIVLSLILKLFLTWNFKTQYFYPLHLYKQTNRKNLDNRNKECHLFQKIGSTFRTKKQLIQQHKADDRNYSKYIKDLVSVWETYETKVDMYPRFRINYYLTFIFIAFNCLCNDIIQYLVLYIQSWEKFKRIYFKNNRDLQTLVVKWQKLYVVVHLRSCLNFTSVANPSMKWLKRYFLPEMFIHRRIKGTKNLIKNQYQRTGTTQFFKQLQHWIRTYPYTQKKKVTRLNLLDLFPISQCIEQNRNKIYKRLIGSVIIHLLKTLTKVINRRDVLKKNTECNFCTRNLHKKNYCRATSLLKLFHMFQCLYKPDCMNNRTTHIKEYQSRIPTYSYFTIHEYTGNRGIIHLLKTVIMGSIQSKQIQTYCTTPRLKYPYKRIQKTFVSYFVNSTQFIYHMTYSVWRNTCSKLILAGKQIVSTRDVSILLAIMILRPLYKSYYGFFTKNVGMNFFKVFKRSQNNKIHVCLHKHNHNPINLTNQIIQHKSSPDEEYHISECIQEETRTNQESLLPSTHCILHTNTYEEPQCTPIISNLPLSISLPARYLDYDLYAFGYDHINILAYGGAGCSHVVRSLEDGSLWVAKIIDLTKLTLPEASSAKLEAEYLQRLRHPFILKFKESFKTHTTLIIITEYCEGGDLFRRVENAAKHEAKYLHHIHNDHTVSKFTDPYKSTMLTHDSDSSDVQSPASHIISKLMNKLNNCCHSLINNVSTDKNAFASTPLSMQQDMCQQSQEHTQKQKLPQANWNVVNTQHDLYQMSPDSQHYIPTSCHDVWDTEDIDLNNGYITPDQIIQWITQLALGLQYMHSQKILHCDLKSTNIFLTRDGTAKIGDLGIAREMGLLDCPRGTPMYMSPEIFHGRQMTDKADSWALGCVLYELVFKKHAFDETTQYYSTFSSSLSKVSTDLEHKLSSVQADIQNFATLPEEIFNSKIKRQEHHHHHHTNPFKEYGSDTTLDSNTMCINASPVNYNPIKLSQHMTQCGFVNDDVCHSVYENLNEQESQEEHTEIVMPQEYHMNIFTYPEHLLIVEKENQKHLSYSFDQESHVKHHKHHSAFQSLLGCKINDDNEIITNDSVMNTEKNNSIDIQSCYAKITSSSYTTPSCYSWASTDIEQPYYPITVKEIYTPFNENKINDFELDLDKDIKQSWNDLQQCMSSDEDTTTNTRKIKSVLTTPRLCHVVHSTNNTEACYNPEHEYNISSCLRYKTDNLHNLNGRSYSHLHVSKFLDHEDSRCRLIINKESTTSYLSDEPIDNNSGHAFIEPDITTQNIDHLKDDYSLKLIYTLLVALLQPDPDNRPSLQTVLEMLYSAEYMPENLNDIDIGYKTITHNTTKRFETPKPLHLNLKPCTIHTIKDCQHTFKKDNKISDYCNRMCCMSCDLDRKMYNEKMNYSKHVKTFNIMRNTMSDITKNSESKNILSPMTTNSNESHHLTLLTDYMCFHRNSLSPYTYHESPTSLQFHTQQSPIPLILNTSPQNRRTRWLSLSHSGNEQCCEHCQELHCVNDDPFFKERLHNLDNPFILGYHRQHQRVISFLLKENSKHVLSPQLRAVAHYLHELPQRQIQLISNKTFDLI